MPCSKLTNQDPFKSVYIKKQLNETMNSLTVCMFQEKDKETAPISKWDFLNRDQACES